MTRLTGVLGVFLLVAACGGPASPKASPSPSPSVSATPTPSPTPVVSATARRLRAIAGRAQAQCPCGLFVRVADRQADAEVELYGMYDPKTNTTWLSNSDSALRVEFRKTGTYFRGPQSRSRWVRLDATRLPKRIKRSTPLSLAALANPAYAFDMARGLLYPNDAGVRDGRRTYSLSYDLAAVHPDAFLARVVGAAPSLYGNLYTRGGALSGLRYDAAGPAGSITVYVEVLRLHEHMLAVQAPATAPVLAVT